MDNLHITPEGEAREEAMNNPTVFQRYIGPSLVATAIALGSAFISFNASNAAANERINEQAKAIDELKNSQKNAASKDDVKRVEDAVITIQGDVKQILRDQATQANKKR